MFVLGIGFVWKFCVFVSKLLERQELCEAPLVLARQARFVAQEERERLAVVCQILEGEGEVEAIIETVSLRGAGCGFDGADLLIHERGFDEPEALLTPAGDGHFLDEDGLAGVRRVVGGGKCGVERGEAFLIFIAEADTRGEARGGREAMGDGVGGGAGFAFGGDGPAGFLGVGALGREAASGLAFVSGHSDAFSGTSFAGARKRETYENW